MTVFLFEPENVLLEDSFLKKVCVKYHFSLSQLQELREVAVKMLPGLEKGACWQRRRMEWQDCGQGNLCETVVISLGRGPDELQDEFASKGLLSESYMIESLANELLLHAYVMYNQYIAEHTDYHVARYHFPGSRESLPLELLPELLRDIAIPVSCNEALCMLPKKSVAFLAELTREAGVVCEGICMGCGNKNCSNRMGNAGHAEHISKGQPDLSLNYGYSRIFGSGEKRDWIRDRVRK